MVNDMPTLDYQVGGSYDDGHWLGTSFSRTQTLFRIGRDISAVYKTFARFTGVTIPVGATIDSAYCSFYFASVVGTPPVCTLYFEDAGNPMQISSYSDGDSRYLTTNNISVTPASSGTWWNTGDIKDIIQELVNSYSYAAGSAMQLIIVGGGASGGNYSATRAYDYTGNVYGPKLHIEYTGAVGGSVSGMMSIYRRRH
jgi:hypothetical protein